MSSVIETVVIKHHEITTKSHMFVRSFLLHSFDPNNPDCLPELDQKFFYQCIRALGAMDKKGADKGPLYSSIENFYLTRFSSQRFDMSGMSNSINQIALDMETVTVNNIWMNFQKRLRNFINQLIPFYVPDWKIKIKNRMKPRPEVEKLKKAFEKNDPTGLEGNYLIFFNLFILFVIPRDYDGRTSLNYEAKVNPTKYLFHLLWMARYLEDNHDRIMTLPKEIRYWKKFGQVLPLRTEVIPCHTTLTTTILRTELSKPLMKIIREQPENRKLTLKQASTTEGVNERFWDVLIDRSKPIFNRQKRPFSWHIKTDGVSASILFGYERKRPIEPKDPFLREDQLTQEQKDSFKNKVVLGCDPGNGNIVTIRGPVGDRITYTKRQREFECGFDLYNNYIRNKRQTRINGKTVEEIESVLSSEDSRSVNLDRFLSFVRRKLEVNSQVSQVYYHPRIRRKRLDRYVRTQKSESRLLNKIEETFGQDIVIGYGDWSVGSQNTLQRSSPAPRIGIRRKINQRFPTVSVDEFRTSKICPLCQGTMDNYQKKHRLLQCSCTVNINGMIHQRIMNRDDVGSENIRALFIRTLNGLERPGIFCRGSPSSQEDTCRRNN